jgi:antitoxin (DNA-binding transcriptional repressor) of toxin-antitoxin stability system
MTTITLHEIERDLLGYLRRVELGETLLIVRDQHPVAEIKPVLSPARQARPYGMCAGEFTVPADFDQPLPNDILKDFEGA